MAAPSDLTRGRLEALRWAYWAEGAAHVVRCRLSMPSDCRNPADPAPLEDLAAYWQWFSFAGAD